VWLPGHLAVAFLLAVPIFLWVQRTNEIRTPIVLVIFFAAFPDFFHLGDLRAVSHSLIGLACLVPIALLVISAFVKLNRIAIFASILGASSHLAGDAYIGHIYPLFPFSNVVFQMHEFNNNFDLNTELALGGLAILAIPLILFLDRKRGWAGRTPKERKFLLLVSLSVIGMGFAEMVLFTQMDLARHYLRYAFLMVPLFAAPVLLLLGWINRRSLARWFRN
jgi:glucan phosphoethanolaminetransferase (alkaline phosphatase superfamily)